MFIECNVTATCRAWKNAQPNPRGLIAGALARGRARMLDWLNEAQDWARLCPLPDFGGAAALFSAFPTLDYEVSEAGGGAGGTCTR